MADICTCTWSPVNTTTENPPHITHMDPDCPVHRDEYERRWHDDRELADATSSSELRYLMWKQNQCR